MQKGGAAGVRVRMYRSRWISGRADAKLANLCRVAVRMWSRTSGDLKQARSDRHAEAATRWRSGRRRGPPNASQGAAAVLSAGLSAATAGAGGVRACGSHCSGRGRAGEKAAPETRRAIRLRRSMRDGARRPNRSSGAPRKRCAANSETVCGPDLDKHVCRPGRVLSARRGERGERDADARPGSLRRRAGAA